MEEISGQQCMVCGKNELTLREDELDIPYFGRVAVFGMSCTACGYKKSDLEPLEAREGAEYTFEVSCEADLNVKVIKSGSATLKIPRMITQSSGPASNGYITTVEGVLERVKSAIQASINGEDDKAVRTKGKNQIKKLNNVLAGRDKIKLIISDKSGCSSIVSDKVTTKKI